MQKFTPMLERLIRRDGEAGQAIVLVALFMLALVGMLGLAIDGGGLFLLYRDARNAADTAALQAAYARCTSPVGSNEYKTVGLDAADENGFRNGSISTVSVEDYSVITGDTADAGKTYINILAEKPSYFARLVFAGPLIIEVESVAFCDRGFDPESEGAGAIARAPDTVCSNAGTSNEFNFTGADIYFDGTLFTYGSFGQSVPVLLQSGSHIWYYGEMKDSQPWYVVTSKDAQALSPSDRAATLPLATEGSQTGGLDPEDFEIFDFDPIGTQIPEPPPSTATASDYAPGGAVFDYIDSYDETASGGVKGYAISYTPSNGKLQNLSEVIALESDLVNADGYIRGLIYVNGDIALTGNSLNDYTPNVLDTWHYTEDAGGADWDEDDFVEAFTGSTSTNGTGWTDDDWEGVTFIASGTVSVDLNGHFVRYYEGLDGFEGSAGLADEISTEQDYSSVLLGSERIAQECANSATSVTFGSSGYAYGLMWAPNARVDLSFSSADFRGALDAWTVSYSGSTSRFWYDPTLIAPRAPSVGQES